MARTSFRDSDAPRNDDGSYDGLAVAEWSRDRAAGDDDDSRLLAAAVDSPALERYRAAKADLAEMQAAERRGQLVDIEAFVNWWTKEPAADIRRATETLRAKFGDAAAQVMVDALAKSDAAIESRQAEITEASRG
jgi:phage terminase Nu1 subunit (DNA packaging protein)